MPKGTIKQYCGACFNSDYSKRKIFKINMETHYNNMKKKRNEEIKADKKSRMFGL